MRKLIDKQFTYREFLDKALYGKRLKKNEIKKGVFDSDECTLSFTQTKNIKEAHELAIKGWQLGIDQLEPKHVRYEGAGRHRKMSIFGSRINMNAVINNDPRQFYRNKKAVPNLKRLNVYIPNSYSGGRCSKKAMIYAKNVLEYVSGLSGDYEVAIYVFLSSQLQKHKKDTAYQIRLKDFGENITLNNLAFAFHPSFFRRFYFRYQEQTDFYENGYGMTRPFDEAAQNLKRVYRETETCWFLPSFNTYGHEPDFDKLKIVIKK